MSDTSQGIGWWIASDGKWYPPELHPTAPPSLPPMALPPLAGNPRGAQQSEVGCSERLSPDLQAPTEERNRRARPAAIIIGLVVALIVLNVGARFAGYVAGEASKHGQPPLSADQITIPSTAPAVLAGQAANPQALGENSAWQQLASQVASQSSVSFISVYGQYPPASRSTSNTFLAVGARPNGGTGNFPAQASGLISQFQAAAAKNLGATVASLPLQGSIYGGEIMCVSITAPTGTAGECFWQTPVTSVEVVTYAPTIAVVEALTEQVITDLHGG